MIESVVQWLLQVLAIPEVGIGSVFLVSFVSATLLPMGSEPTVFAFVKANAAMFWPAMLGATLGNTLGGAVNYWLGLGANRAFTPKQNERWSNLIQRYGAKTMLLSWVPIVGDPLCLLAGWFRLSFWPCLFYMAVGKFFRYLTMTWLLLRVPDGFWKQIGNWLL